MKTPSTLIPYIQYEIRYSNILNFTGWVRDIVNPFVKVATSISLDAPNSHRERIILNFDDEYMQMFVTWDRIIFKSEGDIDKLKHSNSTINTVFFKLVEKISSHESFGTHLNQLLFVTYVNIKTEKKDKVYTDLKSKYLKTKADDILGEKADFAITLQEVKDKIRSSITFGPYVGIPDLSTRNMIPINNTLAAKCSGIGEMAEIKLFSENQKVVKFDSFKELIIQAASLKDKLWK